MVRLVVRFALVVFTLASLAAPAHAARASLPPGVVESSFVSPAGERVLELSVEVPASAAEVWDAWATADGFRSWAVPFAHVEFRPGGVIESSYDPKARPGDRDNIRNEIVAAIPQRVFVMRNVQAPEKVPFDAPTFQKTVTSVSLSPLGERLTRVTVANSGYAAGAPWDGVYEFFRQGNAWSLAQLRTRFEKGPTDWAKALAPKPDAKK